ncbi:hypothetical protein F5B22DRAFT_583524 [Xylaria bambusicola]|uniref:uncharacterized protein n=1 Tax=Xylaria bambusicola TaxID=326684 RepID=UPI00200852BC|nr:uncharacterized protein F5B22DRAFT_583524 [Xylaria bambusicola]KAI0528082.1 hypothetical protein F5B22DRAFT_583524 [Xylaria bambusicola]
MKVIIVGAGIGGLSAAIALNRAGHDVEVYESSSFLNEVGAAIHLAPNATRVLKRWDLDFETLYPVGCEAIQFYSPKLEHIETLVTLKEGQEKLGVTEPWLMTHRVDIHSSLRAHAEKGFQGRAVKIHLRSKVKSVNAETGEVHFEDGRTVQGDLVVGADGIHSRTVTAVISNGADIVNTGQKVFRFLVPVEKAVTNPLVKAFVDKIGLNQLSGIAAANGRMIIYPCRSGTLLNVACFVRTNDDLGPEASWHNAGNLDDLMANLEGYNETVREFGKMAEDLKLWTLVTRNPPPTFFKGKLALLGDAAHPMLPHQGQGGAQAIEDAAALGALFGADTAPEQVSDLLNIYNQVRYDHAVSICISSRIDQRSSEEVLAQNFELLRKFVPNAIKDRNYAFYAWASYPVREVERLLALRRSEKAI